MNKQEIEKAISYVQNMDLSVFVDKDEACNMVDMITDLLEHQLTNGWIPVSDKHPVKHEDELEEQFRNICQEPFKDCETEQDLNERYEELRQIIVCEMSDRAEELGIDPDTL